MIIQSCSHLDHGLGGEAVAYISKKFADRDGFFIETIELPSELGSVPCGLHGPLMGDQPIGDDEVILETRGNRAWESRMVNRPVRQVQTVTVIAGPYEGHSCVLYTAFGGPLAPQEPGDPSCKDQKASEAFWSEHGLSL